MARAQTVTSELVARDVEIASAKQAPTGSRKQHDCAVVIGIDAYSHLRSLDGATRDAQAFSTWLRDKYGGGLRSQNVKLLLSGSGRDTPEHLCSQ